MLNVHTLTAHSEGNWVFSIRQNNFCFPRKRTAIPDLLKVCHIGHGLLYFLLFKTSYYKLGDLTQHAFNISKLLLVRSPSTDLQNSVSWSYLTPIQVKHRVKVSLEIWRVIHFWVSRHWQNLLVVNGVWNSLFFLLHNDYPQITVITSSSQPDGSFHRPLQNGCSLPQGQQENLFFQASKTGLSKMLPSPDSDYPIIFACNVI
jgi:hypothetical protein